MNRRVLAILHQFPPERSVGAQSCAQICRYLPESGWDVTVLTVRHPSAGANPDGVTVIRTGALPHPLSFYRWLKKRAASPLEVEASAGTGTERRGRLRHALLALLQVPDMYTGWVLPAVVSGLSAVRKEKIDCLFSSGPWWTNHVAALILARMTGLPWTAHYRDAWTSAKWIKPATPFSMRIETALERAVVRNASAVVCSTETQAALLRAAHPAVAPHKIMTVPNGYDNDEWLDSESILPARDKFKITYAGNLYHGRSPYPLFRALNGLISGGSLRQSDLIVELLGMCETAEGSRVMDVAESHGLAQSVIAPGLVSKKETIRHMREASLLLLLIDEQNYSIPAKTYEYLRAQRPILALTTGGEAVDLLQSTGGAWIVDPADTDRIRAAVIEAYNAWRQGTDARIPDAQIVAAYDRRVLTARIAEVFERVTQSYRREVTAETIRSAA